MESKFILNVSHLKQNDNEIWGGAPGSVQCAPTTYAAHCLYERPDFFVRVDGESYYEPESIYKADFESLGYKPWQRIEHSAHVDVMAKCYGIKGVFRTDLRAIDIIESIAKGHPVPGAIDYSDSGHVLHWIGYDENGLYANDPNGELQGNQGWYRVNWGDGCTQTSTLGKCDHFSWNLLDQIYFIGGGGWGFIQD